MDKPIIYSKHAELKIEERNLDKNIIADTIRNPDFTEPDRIDESVIHYIKKIEEKYLRVLIRDESDYIFVVTNFFDRRIKSEL